MYGERLIKLTKLNETYDGHRWSGGFGREFLTINSLILFMWDQLVYMSLSLPIKYGGYRPFFLDWKYLISNWPSKTTSHKLYHYIPYVK